MLHTNEEYARPYPGQVRAPMKTVIADWSVWPKYVEPPPKKTRTKKPKLDCSKIGFEYQIKRHAKELKA